MHRRDQAVIIALDVEHYAVISHEAGITMCRLYVRRSFSDCTACIGIPRMQRRVRIRAAHGRYPDLFDCGDAEVFRQGQERLRHQYQDAAN